MIQRVQSIWLFLASLTLFLLLILPVLAKQDAGGETLLYVGGIYHRTNDIVQKTLSYPGLFGLTIATSVLCLVNIFTFKKRSLQKQLTLLTIILNVIIIICVGGYAYMITGGTTGASFQIGIALPVLTLIFCVLAFRGIRQDEQLIRSADRLR